MPTYAIAVKRENRKRISLCEALGQIVDIPNVEIVSESRRGAATIIASDEAIAEVTRRLKASCYIETLIRHHPQAAR